MKPTRNHIYCTDARRAKMLFESEKKADNFIKFNAEEMLEEGKKVPVRSYFCAACNGWHVTSNPNARVFRYATRLEKIKADQEFLHNQLVQERKALRLVNVAQTAYETAVEALAMGDYKTAMKKGRENMTLLESFNAGAGDLRRAYQFMYNVLCQMIPEMYSFMDTDFRKAQGMYAHCNTIRGWLKDVQGFDEYKKVIGGYMDEASEKIKHHQKVCELTATAKLIMSNIDQLPALVQEGEYAEVEACIRQNVATLSRLVDCKEVRALVMECINKMLNVRELMCNVSTSAA